MLVYVRVVIFGCFLTAGICLDEEKIKKACYWSHEVYDPCFGGCAEVSCDNRDTHIRLCFEVCEPGCVCVEPYVRDDRTHDCVLRENCSPTLMGIPKRDSKPSPSEQPEESFRPMNIKPNGQMSSNYQNTQGQRPKIQDSKEQHQGDQSSSIQRLKDQNLKDKGFKGQDFRDQSLGNQGSRVQRLKEEGSRGQDFKEQSSKDQRLGDQGSRVQRLKDKRLRGEIFRGQDFIHQSSIDQRLQKQGFRDISSRNQGFRDQSSKSQVFSNQGSTNQSFKYQSLGGQGFSNQDFKELSSRGQGFNNQDFEEQSFRGRGLNNQGSRDKGSKQDDFSTTSMVHRDNADCYWPNEMYDPCFGGCAEVSCDNPRNHLRPCYSICEPGCVCVEPYVRDDRTHQCALPKDCSPTQLGIPNTHTKHPVNKAPDESFRPVANKLNGNQGVLGSLQAKQP